MNLFLYFGIFMLLSGVFFIIAGQRLFVKKRKGNCQVKDLEIPLRFIKTGIWGAMTGLLVIIIYLFYYYLPPI